ncbi:MAG: hypothetical protein K2Q22_01125, partial [Cytophagales bacterium]|nr:hypothetical protein [Cytophagales bacterium]
MKKIFSWAAISVGIITTSFAQFNISNDPTKFVGDIKNVMVGAKNPECTKAGDDFESAWNSGTYSDKNKKAIIDMAISMNKKKYKVNPQLLTYFRTMADVATAASKSPSMVDSFLIVTQKVYDKYDINYFTKYLQVCSWVFTKNMLYSSTYNSLQFATPKYSFGFISAKADDILGEAKPDTTKKKEDTDEWSSWDKPKTEDDWGNAFVQEKPQTKEQAIVFSVPESKQPSLAGPVIRFGTVDLTIKSIYDSTTIKGTKGTFMFDNNLFVAEGGKFD